ncbi:MAG TPA: C40 family peptidase [Bacilli bacterium]
MANAFHSRMIRIFLALALSLALAVTLFGCGNMNRGGQTQSAEKSKQVKTENINDRTVIPFVQRGGAQLISMRDLVIALQLRAKMDDTGNVYLIGDHDPAIEIPLKTKVAKVGEYPVTLSQAAVMIDGVPHLTVQDTEKLFSDMIRSKKTKNGLEITRTKDEIIPQDDPDFFRDDPADPAARTSAFLPATATAALANVDMNRVISTAKRYLGVKYDFGAKPYPQSGTFDCSSFTRYIFGKFGVQLPRTARAQSREGVWVSRQALWKGDLLFFYVPGRFKSNRVAGHVGIYMGKGKMIHSSPKPKDGVQISNINKPYWKKVFLTAKRVAY